MARVAENLTEKIGQGSLSVLPVRRTRWVAVVAAIWLLLLLALVVWWSAVVYRQAQRIAELETALGQGAASVNAQWDRTRLMMVGESSFFALVLLALSVALAWLYWRENRRARAMQAFFASVTHELRTPLTSIRLQAEAIAEGDQRVQLARRLLEDSYRLESQIDKTLELARIEGGGPLTEQAIPLRGWLEHCAVTCAEAYGDALNVSVEVAPQLPPILADAAAVQVILRNLIENSVRHGGKESVRVRVSAAAAGEHVVIEYQDDGRGVTGDASELGELFGRGDASRGSGVGLYLVRALMKRMGGQVVFAGANSGGFRAQLRFQAARE
jgi:signal transduction histidine kinase